jgi:protein SDA1
MYRREFRAHLDIFVVKLKELKENPAKKSDEMVEYFKFMGHVSGCYRDQIANFLSTEMINLLQQYYSILNVELRKTLVTSLKIMRGKDVVPAAAVLPVFFKLFRCKDKDLREFLHGVIISDLKKLNEKAKNHSINKKMQSFVHGLL